MPLSSFPLNLGWNSTVQKSPFFKGRPNSYFLLTAKYEKAGECKIAYCMCFCSQVFVGTAHSFFFFKSVWRKQKRVSMLCINITSLWGVLHEGHIVLITLLHQKFRQSCFSFLAIWGNWKPIILHCWFEGKCFVCYLQMNKEFFYFLKIHLSILSTQTDVMGRSNFNFSVSHCMLVFYGSSHHCRPICPLKGKNKTACL